MDISYKWSWSIIFKELKTDSLKSDGKIKIRQIYKRHKSWSCTTYKKQSELRSKRCEFLGRKKFKQPILPIIYNFNFKLAITDQWVKFHNSCLSLSLRRRYKNQRSWLIAFDSNFKEKVGIREYYMIGH